MDHKGILTDEMCCYADDSTMTSTNSDHTRLTEKLTENYEKVSAFMINNRLKLNDDKTHLLVITPSSTRARS